MSTITPFSPSNSYTHAKDAYDNAIKWIAEQSALNNASYRTTSLAEDAYMASYLKAKGETA